LIGAAMATVRATLAIRGCDHHFRRLRAAVSDRNPEAIPKAKRPSFHAASVVQLARRRWDRLRTVTYVSHASGSEDW